mgnify:CR=1 FL=1
MAERKAKAAWRGTLKEGNGSIELGSGGFRGKYSYQSRFESGTGTNPEELIGAAHAACFSMALAAILEKAGHSPQTIETTAQVSIDKVKDGFAITRIMLDTKGAVPGITREEFVRQAQVAKETCPVSQVLKAETIELKADLAS